MQFHSKKTAKHLVILKLYIYLNRTLIHSKMNKHLHIIFTSDLWCLHMSNKRLLSQQHVNNVAK